MSSGDFDVRVGAALRQTRLKQGLTQDDLAAVLGVARTTIARYERGQRSLPLDVLVTLADALEVELEVLVPRDGGTRRPAPTSPALSAPLQQIVEVLQRYPHLIPQVLETLSLLLEAEEASLDEEPERLGATPPPV